MRAIKAFSGFSSHKRSAVPVPNEFFQELLADIEDINELKVILYTIWFLHRSGDVVPYIQIGNFQKDAAFMEGLVYGESSPEQALSLALSRAVDRGVLLRAFVRANGGETALYFLNTALGRAAVEAIQKGNWRYTTDSEIPIEIGQEPPNIFHPMSSTSERSRRLLPRHCGRQKVPIHRHGSKKLFRSLSRGMRAIGGMSRRS
jgi:hypothetical protein